MIRQGGHPESVVRGGSGREEPLDPPQRPLVAGVALGQGIFYVLTGLWPIISPSTFEEVTGPKGDWWLVKTFGALISVIGGVMIRSGVQRRVHPDIALVGMISAAALVGSDIIYVSKRRISQVYLLDAMAEIALILAWLAAMRLRKWGELVK